MKTACLSLLIVTCFLINKANAQVGYIITQKGDTIKGEINIGVFGGGKFKAVGQSDYMPVKIDTLKEYQLSDSSVFVLKRIPRSTANMFSKPQILQRIEHGRINLYQYVPPAGDPIITWYASKGTDSLITIKTSDIFWQAAAAKKSAWPFYQICLPMSLMCRRRLIPPGNSTLIPYRSASADIIKLQAAPENNTPRLLVTSLSINSSTRFYFLHNCNKN